ncbi:MAG: hypothetical protein WA783_21430 [Phormidesmis sp.]
MIAKVIADDDGSAGKTETAVSLLAVVSLDNFKMTTLDRTRET